MFYWGFRHITVDDVLGYQDDVGCREHRAHVVAEHLLAEQDCASLLQSLSPLLLLTIQCGEYCFQFVLVHHSSLW